MIAKVTIAALGQLIQTGETDAALLVGIPEGRTFSLWTASATGARAVATPALVELLSRMPDKHETLCRPFFLPGQPSGRLAIHPGRPPSGDRAAPRCRPALRRHSDVDRAAETIRKLLLQARLTPTGFAEIESLLFGCPAEQGPALPKLLRAIGRTSPYVEGRVAPPVQPLPDINPLAPESNWVPNRLLRPPDETDSIADGATSVLSGSLADLRPRETDASDNAGTARLRWLLYRPWALLLAQVVFTQDAWAAEQNAGSLALELADDQENRFEAPARVNVVVIRPSGDEIDCGTLGELIHRVLRQLGVTLLLREDRLKDLDAQLAAVIRKLLHRQVWKFESRGVKGGRSCYRIHEAFSVDCYRIFGAKYFNRGSSRITAAIRATADQWADERNRGGRTA